MKPGHSRSARTPLFAALRRSFTVARQSVRPDAPPCAELIGRRDEARLHRRDFLKATFAATAGLAAGVGSGCATGSAFGGGPRVVIVGAGIAGLNAAHHLKRNGIRAGIYEGANRAGGRIFTARNVLAPDVTTELGGEFIDTNHEDMLNLVSEFNLPLLDMQEDPGMEEGYFFDGRHFSELEVVEAFRPLAQKIQADYDALPEEIDFEHPNNGRELDQMSLSAYFDRIGATGWIRKLLEVAYVTEYGLEAGEQSALNFIFLISTDVSEGAFHVFGDSDERFKIQGGNQRIIDELARRLSNQITLEHRLIAIEDNAAGYLLHFEKPNGAVTVVEAEHVILTLPFTLLRNVELRIEMPAVKRQAIAELGYGNNAKLMFGTRGRPWRDQGFSGNVFTDSGFQSGWDSSRLQGTRDGAFTIYSGGQPGIEIGTGTPAAQLKRLMPSVDAVFPGTADLFNGKVERFHWPTFPWTRGSYACYRPGQWTSIGGAEIMPVRQVYFAGEHCSVDFQGFMNGGAETGRIAAESVLDSLGRKPV